MNVGRVNTRVTVDINTGLTVLHVNLRHERSTATGQNKPFAFHMWIEKGEVLRFAVSQT